jgi:GH15 family glucan-1,4-alpha-glucosidase
VDWLCWPRFDSPSLFARILDPDAGHWSITPVEPYTTSREYIPGTLVLRTVFHTDSGAVMLEDWMHGGSRQALCRMITGLTGQVRLQVSCDLRGDYGRAPADWRSELAYWTTEMHGVSVFLDGFPETADRQGPRLSFEMCSEMGEQAGLSLGWRRPGPSELPYSLRRTRTKWADWSSDLILPAGYQEAVVTSAVVLKGLQYEPSGAIIAAATTSLPEAIGGERNWDYRFSWLRDASFTLFALRAVGRLDEGQSWVDWLNAVAQRGGGHQLAIMYGVEGESGEELTEQTLEHLAGYEGSRPVRIGNGAASQRQLDTYGELLDCLYLQRISSEHPMNLHRALLVRALAQRACEEWELPDEGIWEVRGKPQHFVYSKVMCWVALDRAVRLARRDPEVFADAPLTFWETERDRIRAQIMERGYDEQLGYFTQAYDSEGLDAANLLLAQVGFVSRKDPRFVRTVEAINEQLTRDGMVLRYLLPHVDDALTGEEAPFVICTFWLVLALAQIGERDQARALFERLLAARNDLGLLAEMVEPDGTHLGNTPQAFSHIALIACAFALSDPMQHGRPRLVGPAGLPALHQE